MENLLVQKTTQKTSVNKTQRVQFVVKSIPEEVSFEYVYFQNKKSEVRWEDTNLYYATFSTVPANSEDRILSVDRKEEAQNPLPQIPVLKESGSNSLPEIRFGFRSHFFSIIFSHNRSNTSAKT